MRSTLFALLIAAGCGHGTSPPASPVEAPPPLPSLLAAVGPHPRGYARLSLSDPQLRAQLAPAVAAIPVLLGKSLADCHIDLARLDRMQIAIGEPLRIAAEIDGKIDAHAVACLLGDATLATLVQRGVVIQDRPGGLAIEYQPEHTDAEPARAAGTELANRCAGATCVAIVLGPLDGRLWVQVQHDKITRLELNGPNLGYGAAAVVAAIDSLRASTPELRPLIARAQRGALVIEVPGDGRQAASVGLARALRSHLIEAFKIPSTSMVPTLRMDDHVYIVKGPLFGAPVLGDLLVYNFEGRQFVKRYLAGPGQTISETEAGISIDGKPLATEVVDPSFHYRDTDERDRVVDRSGPLIREHLGARSYLTLRTGPPRGGTWKVPAGQVFFVGDNRNNSNDSRYIGASRDDTIVGRVVGIWLAYHDGVPDWDRMGMPVE
ncbi:MAG TPA: signal peptidase I [Kofleriaceae bacterium]